MIYILFICSCTIKHFRVDINEVGVNVSFLLTQSLLYCCIISGDSSVEFECVEETNLILIHSNKLNYTKLDNGHLATLQAVDSEITAPLITNSWLKTETQYLVVQLDGKLMKNRRYILQTWFTGELADDLGGFYRSEYMEGKQKRYVAVRHRMISYKIRVRLHLIYEAHTNLTKSFLW